ncbi:MAG: IPTL-CTERM sorting domain-containing protein [Thermodesulfobacteriota bacterium]
MGHWHLVMPLLLILMFGLGQTATVEAQNLDAVFSNNGQINRVCLGDGAGGFSCSNVSTDTNFSQNVSLGLVNADSNLDAVFSNANQSNRVCLGDGAGGFTCSDVSTDTNQSFGVSLGALTTPIPPPTFINLSPNSATNDVLTDHTVTSTVDIDEIPEPGILVTFEVISGPNAGEMSDPNSGECSVNDDCTTDENGQVSWTYTGSKFPGTDTIVGSFFDERTQEVLDSNLVEKIWVIPPSNVPTLSEWGLIVMAGILGLVGFMVIRRRKVAA